MVGTFLKLVLLRSAFRLAVFAGFVPKGIPSFSMDFPNTLPVLPFSTAFFGTIAGMIFHHFPPRSAWLDFKVRSDSAFAEFT